MPPTKPASADSPSATAPRGGEPSPGPPDVLVVTLEGRLPTNNVFARLPLKSALALKRRLRASGSAACTSAAASATWTPGGSP